MHVIFPQEGFPWYQLLRGYSAHVLNVADITKVKVTQYNRETGGGPGEVSPQETQAQLGLCLQKTSTNKSTFKVFTSIVVGRERNTVVWEFALFASWD